MKVAILGGGVGGLSAAYHALKNSNIHCTTIFEASERVGGLIRSVKGANDVIFEQGPRLIRFDRSNITSYVTLDLVENLGLKPNIKPILSTNEVHSRLLYAKGRLMEFATPTSLFKLQEPFSRPLYVSINQDIKTPASDLQDDSIYDFISRRFGEDIAENLISPIICGICGGDAKQISVKFLFPKALDYERKYRSVLLGYVLDSIANKFRKSSIGKVGLDSLVAKAKQQKWDSYSFDGGCEALPIALTNFIKEKGVKILLNHPCEKLILDNNKVILHCNNHDFEFDHVICALPAEKLSILLKDQHAKLSKDLNNIKNVSMCTTNLEYSKILIDKPAFGLLVRPNEKLPVLGVIYDSCLFPKKNRTILSVMMGGHCFHEHFANDTTKEYYLETALKYIKQILNIGIPPTNHQVNILHNAIPQYTVGHSERKDRINKYIEQNKLPISLCGASYDGVGVNDVVASGKKAADQLINTHQE